MKGIICYYSSTGNTKLAVEYIAKQIKNAKFDLFNTVRNVPPDFSKYDIVGFAAFTDFGGVSQYMCSFIESIPMQAKKHAFVFNTYGMVSGKTLKHLAKIIDARGFDVLVGYSLRMPENFPPNVIRGLLSADAPNKKEKARFDKFINNLDQIIKDIKDEKSIKKSKISIGFMSSLIPQMPRTAARKNMGMKYVHKELCVGCKTCIEGCPYYAISYENEHKFDMAKCHGCWSCYNNCPQKAIYTADVEGEGHYIGPSEEVIARLS